MADLGIVVPADPQQTREAVRWAASAQTGVFLRVGRYKVPAVSDPAVPFEYGVSQQLADGDDVTVFAAGTMVSRALEAARAAAEEGVSVRVVNMHTVAPLDVEAVRRAVRETRGIVTAEEATVTGGLGAAIAEVVVRENPVPMRLLGIDRQFAPTGTTSFLLEHFGLTADHVRAAALELAARG